MRFLFLTVGMGGHGQAAAAVEEALTAADPALEVTRADFVELVSPFIGRASHAFYVHWLRSWPASYGYVYRASRDARPAARIDTWLSRFGAAQVQALVAALTPDAVLSLHPIPTVVLGSLRQKGLLSAPLVTVLTDHALHNRWLHPGVDLACAPDERVAQAMLHQGVPAARVAVTGIPVRRAFAPAGRRATARLVLGLEPDRFTVLVMVGAYGMLPATQGVVAAVSLPGLQVLVLTGHDRILAGRLRRRLAGQPGLHVYGFREDVATFMQAADLLVTKAGGVTVAEALAVGLPMVIYRPLPGQEQENADFVVQGGAGLVVEDLPSLRQAILSLSGDPARLDLLARRAAALGRPQAAQKVASFLMDLARGNQSPARPPARPGGLTKRAATGKTVPLPH